MLKFNTWLFKYRLSTAIVKEIGSHTHCVSKVSMDSTSAPQDPNKFYANIAANGTLEEYAKYCEETARLSIHDKNGWLRNYYILFRNGLHRDSNGDISYTKPSSVEIGYVANGAYVSINKIHYSSYFDPEQGFQDEADCKTKINMVIADVINTVTGHLRITIPCFDD